MGIKPDKINAIKLLFAIAMANFILASFGYNGTASSIQNILGWIFSVGITAWFVHELKQRQEA